MTIFITFDFESPPFFFKKSQKPETNFYSEGLRSVIADCIMNLFLTTSLSLVLVTKSCTLQAAIIPGGMIPDIGFTIKSLGAVVFIL